ncbi:aminoglycoside phosphotransferase family protein [Consotaella aegiceratis]|uniref:aminoglycoside phosphotransferase family protein n=1 Tax=Consotaella aegiceratis TaxID=3097961 RepID=UPI002F3F4BFF
MTLESYIRRWELVPDGEEIVTASSRLMPVLRRGDPAMLKLALIDEERRGVALMEWWGGAGAAAVLATGEGAVLLERATGPRSLIRMAYDGQDEEACRILCATAARLHAPRPRPKPADLVPLPVWFRDLAPAAERHGGIFARSADAARLLFSTQKDVVVLHGDIHHGNVLDFGPRGWLAIDPKSLIGERGFDFANIFPNPYVAEPGRPVDIDPDRFRARVAVVAKAADLERRRLLLWILAWSGLSAAWSRPDASDPPLTLQVAELAAAELGR